MCEILVYKKNTLSNGADVTRGNSPGHCFDIAIASGMTCKNRMAQ